MNSKHLLLISSCLLLLGGAAAWIGLSGSPAEAAPREAEPVGTQPGGQPEPSALAAHGASPTSKPSTVAPESPREEQPSLRQNGAILGDVELAANAYSQIEAITVTVLEAINQVPNTPQRRLPFTASKLLAIDRGGSTPTFSFPEVPFSEYGYFVNAFAAGLNGSECFVHVTKQKPVADGVILRVSTGVPFSVVVRDQLAVPIADLLITLIPQGIPLGRPQLVKRTDNYGSLVFESVLRGDYKLIAGPQHAPLCEPKLLTVQADGGRNVQCQMVTVPRGSDLNVEVFSPSGHGLADAEINLIATDTTIWRSITERTDHTGQRLFRHLPPGSYQVNVRALGYDLWSRNWQVPEGEAAKPLTVRLVPQ